MNAKVSLLATVLLAACAPKEPPKPREAQRPVTVFLLEEADPVKPLLLTGSVRSWKEQDVAFEVEGVVRFVVEPGTNLEGRWVEDERVRVEGGILARMDTQSYEIALATAAAGVEVAREKLDTARVQLAKVLPAQLKAAEANLIRAEEEYKREVQLYEKEAVSKVDVIRKRADRDARDANVEEAKAQMDAQKADIKALEAQVQRAKERRRQAEYDLSRCSLYAPFSGEISDVYIEAGGYARRGQKVAHLVMMTPIKVDLAVSPATAAKMRRGDAVRLYVAEGTDPVFGSVYEKATTADPETRTFRISIILKNSRIRAPFGPEDPRTALPRVEMTMPLVVSAQGYPVVEERHCLREDDGGHYVWADPAADIYSVPDGTVLNLKKFYIKLGERRHSLQGLYLVREVVDAGGLPIGTLLPFDVPATDAEETRVVVAKPQWMLRPGQLVPVLLTKEAPKPGLYVPMDAILPVSESRGILFLEVDGQARRVEVRLLDRVRVYQRVEGEGVAAGARVITDYVHFLQDGERVRVIRTREMKS
jgi:multidrug efflux pump subunit AcrA (membrane-fusion protein)